MPRLITQKKTAVKGIRSIHYGTMFGKMTASMLRTSLSRLGLSQVQLARLLGVTTRAISLWLGEQRAVPPPVDAYLRLLAAVPEAIRLAELQRFNESEITMRDGMYAVEYYSNDTGQTMAGYGFVAFDVGKVYGGDAFGGTYNGECIYNPATGLAEVKIKLTFPPGGMAVFGVSLPYEWSVEATTRFDPLANPGAAVLTTANGQTVNVAFRFIRALPDAA
jgi:transcriptional regulator with XRE-family HTH domain